ncbi:hypothetical protein DERP_001257 [Dermatophagoides pteronyssinus]|uniref:Uncharacterized protein n=1 Tax=Dermatophagoides pteronyssinus TaxID=6956 RepID=A0ABQ8JDY8_DERPT|nr:hypothetical protein DERP_001257 [Dermatophagoides pteronyssinus]
MKKVRTQLNFQSFFIMDHKSKNLGFNLSSTLSSEESIIDSSLSAPSSSVVTSVITGGSFRFQVALPSASSASSTSKKNESSPLVKKPGWRRFVSRKQVDDFIFVYLYTKNETTQKFDEDIIIELFLF